MVRKYGYMVFRDGIRRSNLVLYQKGFLVLDRTLGLTQDFFKRLSKHLVLQIGFDLLHAFRNAGRIFCVDYDYSVALEILRDENSSLGLNELYKHTGSHVRVH